MTRDQMRDEFRRFRIQITALIVGTNLVSVAILLAALSHFQA